ncbi:MAG: PDZ domain-containing protein, partial [Pirellulaceae bacterium]|nr:PDZ domain-containing protein [Pirellulaceae bacterium]
LPAPAAPPPVGPPPVDPAPVARPPVDPAQPPAGDLEAELGAPLAARPSLGVTVVEVSDAARQRYGLNVARGALITSIRAGSPADRAGLPLGAVIVAVDGRRVDSPAELAELVGQFDPASSVEVAYYQADRLVRKRVDLAPVANLSPPGLPRLDPAEEPALRLGGGLADRPLLGRLEQALGGLIRPQEGEAGGPAGPASPRSEVDQLRAEVEALRRHITRLEERLAELERRLPAGR